VSSSVCSRPLWHHLSSSSRACGGHEVRGDWLRDKVSDVEDGSYIVVLVPFQVILDTHDGRKAGVYIAESRALRWKIDLRIMPILMGIYFLQYLDTYFSGCVVGTCLVASSAIVSLVFMLPGWLTDDQEHEAGVYIAESRALRWKIDLRIMPILMGIYFLQYLAVLILLRVCGWHLLGCLERNSFFGVHVAWLVNG
jgi:uncharacterized membrane protein